MTIEPFEFGNGLWRGPEPVTDADFDVLSELGITQVVDLELHLSPWSSWHLEDMLVGRGIQQVTLPMIPVLPPTQAQLLYSSRLLAKAETSQVSTYVHCRQGVDRTGMTVAAFKLFAWHETYADVLTDMLAFGFHRWRYNHWLPALREFADTYGMSG